MHPPNSLRILISAAEPSGDMHAASLINAFRRLHPQTTFVGVAGPKMQAAGCEPLADFTSRAGMLTGVFANAGFAAQVLSRVTHELSHHHYDAAVLLDSPMLNLPIALRAKMRAIPVLYYIAPQLWAWGANRVHKVRSRVDKLAVVLPFEEDYFRNVGLDATFVGHPLFDVLHRRTPDPEIVRDFQNQGQPVIAVLPGSRRHVVAEVLPGQLQVAAAIRQRFPSAHIGISVADRRLDDLIKPLLTASGVSADLCHDRNAELLSAADLALVASGTATLEVAHYGAPMIVMYNGSKLMYHLVGRWLIKLKHLSLVNILADRELVPEFMPYYDSVRPIADSAIKLLASPDRLERMKIDLKQLLSTLDAPGASDRTAKMLENLIHAPH